MLVCQSEQDVALHQSLIAASSEEKNTNPYKSNPFKFAFVLNTCRCICAAFGPGKNKSFSTTWIPPSTLWSPPACICSAGLRPQTSYDDKAFHSHGKTGNGSPRIHRFCGLCEFRGLHRPEQLRTSGQGRKLGWTFRPAAAVVVVVVVIGLRMDACDLKASGRRAFTKQQSWAGNQVRDGPASVISASQISDRYLHASVIFAFSMPMPPWETRYY